MQLSELNIPQSGINLVVDEILNYMQGLKDGNGKTVLAVADRRLESKKANDDPKLAPSLHIIHNLAKDEANAVQFYDLRLIRTISFYVMCFERRNTAIVQQRMEDLFMFLINALQDAKIKHSRDLWKWNNPQKIIADFHDALRKTGGRYTCDPPWYCFRFDLDVWANNVSISA